MKQGVKKTWNNYKKLFKEAFDDLKTKGRRHRQIPNLLTLTRLIAAPCFIIPAAIMANVPLIIIFTVIFSLTDLLDGFIARKYNLTSELGKDLDAICDKIFAATLLLCASFFNPILLFNLVFECIIAAINVSSKLKIQSPRSLYVGKIKAWVLYPLLGVGFLSEFAPVKDLFNTLFVATVSMQMLTVASYLIKYDKDKKDDKVLKNNKKTGTTGEIEEIRDLLLHEADISSNSKK